MGNRQSKITQKSFSLTAFPFRGGEVHVTNCMVSFSISSEPAPNVIDFTNPFTQRRFAVIVEGKSVPFIPGSDDMLQVRYEEFDFDDKNNQWVLREPIAAPFPCKGLFYNKQFNLEIVPDTANSNKEWAQYQCKINGNKMFAIHFTFLPNAIFKVKISGVKCKNARKIKSKTSTGKPCTKIVFKP